MDDCASLLEHAIFGTSPDQNPWPIAMKLCAFNYVGQITKFANNGSIPLAAAAPEISKIMTWSLYSSYLYLTYSFSVWSHQIAQPILTHVGSNYAVWSSKVPFAALVVTKQHIGVQNPPEPSSFCPQMFKIPANLCTPVTFNRWDGCKIWKNHLYKIWLHESIGDIVSGLKRPLSVEMSKTHTCT